MARRAHRSFVSYIDKSREYYAAQGYASPYRWAVADSVPFCEPTRPVAASRLGVVTTAFFPMGSEPEGVPPLRGTDAFPHKEAYAAPIVTAAAATYTRDLAWAKKETHTDDVDSYLPVSHLQDMVDRGELGSLSDRFYGVPTEYSQRRTAEESAPRIEAWMREDGVDQALLVGL